MKIGYPVSLCFLHDDLQINDGQTGINFLVKVYSLSSISKGGGKRITIRVIVPDMYRLLTLTYKKRGAKMTTVNSKGHLTLICACLASAFTAMVLFSGCNDDSVTSSNRDQISKVIIIPDSIGIAVGEQVDFSAYLLDDADDNVDTEGLNIEWNWWSSNTDVFTVEPGGLATAKSPGEEFCIVEVTVLHGSSNFTGRDTAFVFIF